MFPAEPLRQGSNGIQVWKPDNQFVHSIFQNMEYDQTKFKIKFCYAVESWQSKPEVVCNAVMVLLVFFPEQTFIAYTLNMYKLSWFTSIRIHCNTS